MQDMLRKILKKLLDVPVNMLGTVYDLLKKMVDEPDEWVEATKRFLRKENPWPETVNKTVEKAKKSLLKLVTTITTAAVEIFSVQEKFRVGEQDGVKIGGLGENFQRVFGSKVEKGVAQATLRIHKLLQSSVDGPILAELGDTAETTLAQIWEMLKKQGHGQKGDLLTNGYANIFYVKDDDGNFWAINCNWYSYYGDWYVEAYPVTDPNQWNDDRQFVSR